MAEKATKTPIVVPGGPNSATVQVLDANGSDITGSCIITATSSDPAVLQIGTPDAATPNVIPFTALEPGQSAEITYDASNTEGDVTQTDSVEVQITAPASMMVTYGASVAVVKKASAKK